MAGVSLLRARPCPISHLSPAHAVRPATAQAQEEHGMQDDQSGNAQQSRPTPGMAGATGREPMPDTFANPDAADTAPGLAERVGMRGQDRTPKMDTPRESRATQSTG